MDAYNRHKEVLLDINNDILGLIEATRSVPELSHEAVAEWEKTCRLLPQQLEEEIMRVAVVGTIKSGKSTFLNSLLQGDYLKRGAGVITSIVTVESWTIWRPRIAGSTFAPRVSILWTIRYFRLGCSSNKRTRTPFRKRFGTSYQCPTGCRH